MVIFKQLLASFKRKPTQLPNSALLVKIVWERSKLLEQGYEDKELKMVRLHPDRVKALEKEWQAPVVEFCGMAVSKDTRLDVNSFQIVLGEIEAH